MEIQVKTQGIHGDEVDVLILGISKDDVKKDSFFAIVDQALGGTLEKLKESKEINADFKNTQTLYTLGQMGARRVLILGLGESKDLTFETLREAAARAVKEALKEKLTRVAFVVGDVLGDTQREAHAIVEGALLADYRFAGYHKVQEEKPSLLSLDLYCEQERETDVKEGSRLGQTFATGTCLARDLVNMPGNYLTATVLAEKAKELAEKHGMAIEILDKEEIKAYGMGGLLGVNQGSAQPPKLIAIKYNGTDKWENVLGFVGKGITFDSGGISIKPGAGMDEMKGDMGGAAAVLGALDIIGNLRPAINIVAVIPTTDNMPDGNALKPGDVITTMSGKTIEILNTDAEGRLVLADGMAYAKKLGADYLIDLATLTGAALVALGTCTTAAITNNEDLVENVFEAAAEAGELVWRLPAYKQYKELIKSQIADLKNTGGRNAGTITAGLFVGEFAEETPWVHLDIAGTSWTEKTGDESPHGGSGAMVRTLANLAINFQN